MKFIDLFSGIGGFRLALENQGCECVFACELSNKKRDIYFQNFNMKPFEDITKINVKDIPSHEIITAGMPVQAFSSIGKKGGFDDSRGKLFFDIIRIAKYHKPYFIIMENVRNIVTMENGKLLKTIKSELQKINYRLHYQTLNASEFGIPQFRIKTFLIAIKNDLNYSYIPLKGTFQQVFLKDILESEAIPNMVVRNDIKIFKNDNEIDCMLKPIQLGYIGKGGRAERIYSVKGHAIALLANAGGGGGKTGLYMTPQGVRILTINECKRLMGFPTTHIVSKGGQGYKELGDAVIPKLVELVYNNIIKIK